MDKKAAHVLEFCSVSMTLHQDHFQIPSQAIPLQGKSKKCRQIQKFYIQNFAFEEDDEEEENENDEDFPPFRSPTPPSSPVLTSQQSQASKYCELDKFTKQWSGKIIRFKEPVLGKKEEPSKKEEPMRLKSRVLHDNKSK
jgi:hypothetical protein